MLISFKNVTTLVELRPPANVYPLYLYKSGWIYVKGQKKRVANANANAHFYSFVKLKSNVYFFEFLLIRLSSITDLPDAI
jgi:hypothetical protein